MVARSPLRLDIGASVCVGERPPLVLLWPPPSHDVKGPRSADRVFEQLERHAIADAEIIEGGALVQIGPMKVDFARIRQADEPIPLPHEDSHDPPRHGRTVAILWPNGFL